VKPIVGGRPSWWTRWDITSGLFSAVVLVWMEIAGAGLELELWLELGLGLYLEAQRPFGCVGRRRRPWMCVMFQIGSEPSEV
jgi:hypothetical protein